MEAVKGVLILFSVINGVYAHRLDDLVNSIFEDYESSIRPSCETIEVTDVDIDLGLRQIIDLDEPRQILNTIIWIRLAWSDCRLRWFNTEYSDIESIVLPQHRIWVPDITLYDNAANKLHGIDDHHLTVDQNGTVKYNFPSVIKSLCGVDVTHFPFDYQACRLEFGSWAHSGSQLNIRNSSRSADLTSYIESVEWTIKSAPFIRHVTYYDVEPFPTVRLYILLERRPMFHMLNLLFPCLLITSIAMLGFLLPPVSGEKVNLEITVLLSLAVFQLIVLELMPPTSDSVSFIGLFFTISMVLVSLSCFATVTVLNIHFKGNGDTTIPRWLKICFYIPLTKIMCMADVRTQWKRSSSASHYRSRELRNRRRSSGFSSLKTYRSNPTTNGIHLHESDFQKGSIVSHNGNCHVETINGDVRMSDTMTHDFSSLELPSSSKRYEVKQIPVVIDHIDSAISDIEEHLTEMDTQQASIASSEWRIFSMMLDRLFLALYFIFLVTIAISLGTRYIQVRDLPKLFTDLHVSDDLMRY